MLNLEIATVGKRWRSAHSVFWCRICGQRFWAGGRDCDFTVYVCQDRSDFAHGYVCLDCARLYLIAQELAQC